MVFQISIHKKFESSFIQELNGHSDRGVSTLVPVSDTTGYRVYNVHFVNSVNLREKSHLFLRRCLW